MMLSEKIKNKLLLIKDKPKMVFSGDYNFYVLKFFMMGYMNGLGDAYSINLNEKISAGMIRKRVYRYLFLLVII